MPRRFTLLFAGLIIVLGLPATAAAQTGDTTVVQVFTYGNAQDSMITFPDGNWSQILMEYRLRCVPGGAGGLQFPCGEWDYLTYTFLYHNTGQQDSTLETQPTYRLNNWFEPDTLRYRNTPAWEAFQYWHYERSYTDTSSFLEAEIGNSNGTAGALLPNVQQAGRSLWRVPANSLSQAGLTAGPLTGLRLNVLSPGDTVRFLEVRLRHADNSPNPHLANDFQLVYRRNTAFTPGWFSLPFAHPFQWDGTSDVWVALNFTDTVSGTPPTFALADTAGQAQLLQSLENDYALYCNGEESFAEIPEESHFDFTGPMTLEAWVNVEQYNKTWQAILTKGDNAWRLQRDNNGNSVQFDWNGLGGNLQGNTSINDGRWHHVAVVYDGNLLSLYIDGQLDDSTSVSGTPATNDFNVWIGNNAQQTAREFQGWIDEVRIWRTALTPNELALSHAPLQVSHPQIDSLVAYYSFEGALGPGAPNFGGAPAPAALYTGNAARALLRGPMRYMVQPGSLGVPHSYLEQGSFTSTLDSTAVPEFRQRFPSFVTYYQDSLAAPAPTGQATYYPAGWHYTYGPTGNRLDSVLLAPDNEEYIAYNPYWSEPFDVIERFELGRYITPYGIGLDLGEGFSWMYDLTDYAPILQGTHRMTAGNWQEWLDLKLLFIEGTPPRQVLSIDNVYTGRHNYTSSSDIENNSLTEQKRYILPQTQTARLKITTTGHGFGGTQNCAEFCPRMNNIKINGNTQFEQILWDEDCAENPLYPQGGTWIYNRAGWCPGDKATIFDYEITPFITPDDTIRIDYDMQSGYNWNGQGSMPYYRIESQLVQYGPPNFQQDVRIEEIIAPNTAKRFGRQNPICGSPIIRLRNTGAQVLSSCTIQYGVVGGDTATYTWNGTLEFMEAAEVTLPPFANGNPWAGSQRFFAQVSAPNGAADEYTHNNLLFSNFEPAPVLPDELVLVFQTNIAANESSWELTDDQGNIIDARNGMQFNTQYRDTFQLADGCYTLRILDSGEDGLDFFANNDGSGFVDLRQLNNFNIHSFNPDFGSEASFRFIVDSDPVAQPELQRQPVRFGVFPNPSSGQVNIDFALPERQQLNFSVYNAAGQHVWQRNLQRVQAGQLEADLSHLSSGIYQVVLRTAKGQVQVRRLVLE